MKKILTLSLLVVSSFSFAQQEGSAFTSTGRAVSTTFARDYEAIDINPANLAWGTGYEGKKISVGLLEFGASAYSNILEKERLSELFGGSSSTPFDRSTAVEAFTGNGFALNMDIAPISFAFTNETFGGLAVDTKERFQFFSVMGDQTADIFVNGYRSAFFDSIDVDDGGSGYRVANDSASIANAIAAGHTINFGFANQGKLLSELLEGTNINVSWTREYNIYYGRTLVKNEGSFELGGGIGLKYVQGFAVMNIGVNNDGDLSVFASTSEDLNIDVTGQSGFNPDFGSAPFFKPAGTGFGVDLGVNALINDKIHLGLAVNNLGSIKWKGDAYTVKDTIFSTIESGGFESYNVIEESMNIAADDELFQFEAQNELKVKMAATLRVGASVDFIENRLHVGADAIIPINDAPGNFQQPIFGLGGDFRIWPWFEIETGWNYGGNTQKRLNWPIGITFHVGKSGTYEAGVASRDFITWFRSNAPNLSAAFGFLRFRF